MNIFGYDFVLEFCKMLNFMHWGKLGKVYKRTLERDFYYFIVSYNYM